MNRDEQRIIEGLKKGDNRAYKYLYDCYYVLLCRIASTFFKDSHLAQMLVDNTIFHIYEKRETLLINISLRAYLVRSVRNRCIDHLRSEYEKKGSQFFGCRYCRRSVILHRGRRLSPCHTFGKGIGTGNPIRGRTPARRMPDGF
jgi:DNA-directed RNA polymerase specialized sigma24 family protein